MWSHILTLTLLTVVKTSHVAKNGTETNSDVIVTYSNHAEAIETPKVIPKPVTDTTVTTDIVKILIPESYATETTVFFEDDTESVIFVPNDKPVYRNNDFRDETVNLGDIVRRKTVADVIGDKKIRLETESPSQDFVFITGKNNENVEKPKKETTYQNHETRRSEKERPKKISLDCSNLDCNNTLKSVCGAKMENRHWRYRVFLNECYFRRVNCDFKYEINRFKVMPDEFCKPIASHHSERPFVYNPPLPLFPREPPTPVPNIRRSFSSRRSLNIEVDGKFCSHPCPSTCSEAYAPECAVTSRGHRKVFVNHCKLDYDSCSYGTVWHTRPLSECVGSQKADLRQNRAFVGWMQRIGIVDNKGKLVLA